ncbi:hypothetical protein Hypma_001284 [Hypsizygus marmoreus]|uniref:GATA-type domain-containing protein n=1 Tax=Hypsizygus marmoreus TaxID=39966 RepID=A0A369J8I1_HYPMA|nr:hypothetical protein Hypma_001284 [Hypsizygus marmoreus]
MRGLIRSPTGEREGVREYGVDLGKIVGMVWSKELEVECLEQLVRLHVRRALTARCGRTNENPSMLIPVARSAQCHNCHTTATPSGGTRRCSIYYKLHGSARPIYVKSDVVRKRSSHDARRGGSINSLPSPRALASAAMLLLLMRRLPHFRPTPLPR